MKKFLLVILIFVGGCQTLQKFSRSSSVTPEQRKAYIEELNLAWGLLSDNKPEMALAAFQKFLTNHPQTTFETEAKFGEADAFRSLGQWSEASAVYREIIAERLVTHPELAALAMFEQANIAEALGNESEMLADLQGAEIHGAVLPAEIRLAALPARLAVAHTKLGQMNEAQKYRLLAEQGINQLRAQGLQPAQWAKLYFEMGSFSTHQLATENFQASLDSFASAQIFLLKSVEAGVPPWSDRALASIQEHYRDFWNLAMNPTISLGLDLGAQERMKSELESSWLGQIAKLLVQLKQNYKPEELAISAQEKTLRDFVTKLDDETQKRLMSTSTALPLTIESQRRQGLRRGGIVHSVPTFPSEKAEKITKKPVVELPAKDPNLNRGDQ